MDQRRRISGRWILVVLVGFGLIVWFVSSFIESKLEIGRETTYVTGPLTPDGLIDYPAALAEQLTKDVKLEDNAAILIDRAFGPAAIPPELRERYFEWLGTAPLPEQGDYIVYQLSLVSRKRNGGATSAEENEAALKEYGHAQHQPWTRADCPLAAEWLEVNAGPLELIEQATRRPHYCSPLTSDEGLEHSQNLREAARLLSTRAMFRLGEKNVDGAWSDLLACHRLAQLVSQRASTINTLLVAVALDGMASHVDAAIMANGLSAEQARNFMTDHAQLPSFASLAEVLDLGQRLNSLNSVLQQSAATGLDVNTMLRRTNRICDDLVSALKHDTFAERKKSLAEIESDLKGRIVVAQKPLEMASSLLFRSRRTSSVSDAIHSMFLPALVQADRAQVRAQIRRDLVQIGFALTAFHAEQGVYPQMLDVLVPRYLSAVPLDKFTDKPLVYVPRENGFLIYSIGDNGQDDGGVIGGPGKADDVSLEVPQKTDE